ncbi:MAG: PQQ-dependent sugar dehydrogenase [Actinobacteria bacterium]|nr:PQQ-dependent sugar dehydrogenase [Actinomycetota bacterium]
MSVRLGSRQELLRVHEPIHDADNHFGGQLAFGLDRMLYVGIGDGMTPHRRRIPPRCSERSSGSTPATLRASRRSSVSGCNPWRFSFDQETGDLYVGDVGANTWEEIDRVPGKTT